MLFFRLTLVPIQEGKMGDAISYAEEKVDEFMEVPGSVSYTHLRAHET